MAVVCPGCGGSNDDAARFCSQCGSSLVIQCPSCGTEAAPGARFCSACGSALAAEVDEGPVAEERRVVSVLFCDLVGFTSHTERSDPEDVRSRLITYHARVRQDVERFGGRVEKLMGDGVFAVFGTPTAHENDPERAVRAALRIQDSVVELNQSQPDLALVVRAAVTTGEALVQLEDRPDREGVVGDVVNTASRLEGVAEPGAVVVDERTYLAARGAIDFDALDPVEVKGKAGSIAIWRAGGARSRYGVAVEEEVATPFVGRTDELGLLVDAFERAVARSAPQLVTITGEPGVGKSRLIREFRRAIDDRPDLAWWRQGRCLPYGEGVSFWAIGELVKAQAGILESEPPDVVAAKLRQAVDTLVDDTEDAEWVSLRLHPLTGMGGAEGVDRGELFAAWLRFFEALAARNPLIMVIEDLHWADDAVIEFLDYLSEWATHAPILVVVTARPELFTDRPSWGAGRRDAASVTLDPLSAEESATLMVALTDRPVMPADLQRTLLDRAAGNPLYVTEYVHLAEEQGWFIKAERGEDLPLPDTIHAIIGARIDLLSPEDKTLLQTAAVMGRVFWSGALTFADVGSADEVRESLRRLSRRELVRPVRRSSMQGQDEYSFSHVLIRDVAYGRLTREERARHHEATARWLEAVSGDRAADVAELLAHHLATAYELAPSPDPDRRRRIYRFLLLAAERSASFDPARAAEHAQRAVSFAAGDAERGRALIEYGEALQDSDLAADALDEAVGCFARTGDRAGEAEALRLRGRIEWYRGNADEVDRIDDRLMELIEDLPPSDVVASVLVAVASKRQLRGQEEEALDLVERGIAIAQEVGDTAAYSRGLVIRGSALMQLGHPDGLADVHEALRIQLDRNLVAQAMSTYNNLSTYYITSGEPGRGLEIIDEGIELGEARGQVLGVDWSQMTRCEALFPLGRFNEVLETTSRYLDQERTRGTQTRTGMLSWDAAVRFIRGETGLAWSLWQEVLESARQIQDPQVLVPALGFGALAAFGAGDTEAAHALAVEFAELGPDHPVFLGIYLMYVIHPMMAMGMADDLAGLLAVAERAADPGWNTIELDRARAALAAAEGRYADAMDLLGPVIEMADERGMLPAATESRIDSARSALALGDRAAADELLAAAHEAAVGMEAGLYLDQIAELRSEGTAATGT